jgi:GNAT superfamily N-acetyltransferase
VHDEVREPHCSVSFADGTTVEVRPIRPDDAAGLVAFHRDLSSRTTYLRFFSFHPELSSQEVERFTHVDMVDRVALVVELDGRIVAVGRFDRIEGTTSAEVAFVVADELQGHGLGPVLLDELAAAALERGITTFLAETLGENHPMLDVFYSSGYPVTSRRDRESVALEFPIAPCDGSRSSFAKRAATVVRTAIGENEPS